MMNSYQILLLLRKILLRQCIPALPQDNINKDQSNNNKPKVFLWDYTESNMLVIFSSKML